MKLRIIVVGKLKEKYLAEGIREYQKRMTRKVELLELADKRIPEKPSQKEQEKILDQEGTAILGRIKPSDYVIVLAIEGETLTSEAFALKIQQIETYESGDLVLVIGGSLGTAKAVKKRANCLLSFGRLTLPHQLMRLVLMEQLYRAQMINRGSTYHK